MCPVINAQYTKVPGDDGRGAVRLGVFLQSFRHRRAKRESYMWQKMTLSWPSASVFGLFVKTRGCFFYL